MILFKQNKNSGDRVWDRIKDTDTTSFRLKKRRKRSERRSENSTQRSA